MRLSRGQRQREGRPIAKAVLEAPCGAARLPRGKRHRIPLNVRAPRPLYVPALINHNWGLDPHFTP